MPKTGDHYEVAIKPSHIDWSRYRYTETRERIAGEAYVKIPRADAVRLNIHREAATQQPSPMDSPLFPYVLQATLLQEILLQNSSRVTEISRPLAAGMPMPERKLAML